jgi:two-component system cell cycle response regulator
MRPEDLLARIGGEEFLIVLPKSTCAEGAERARTLCDSIGNTPIRLKDGRSVQVTLSIGIAQASPGTLPDHVIEQADRALHAAKTQGRNRVIVSRSAA